MEALGRLTSGLANEFNNLLTVISGYGQLLLSRAAAQPAMRDELLELLRTNEQAACLMRQLVSFSGQEECLAQVQDLNAVVADCARTLWMLVGEDVQLTTALTPGLPGVRMRRGQLWHILLHLATNARAAMPHGGKLILETALGAVDLTRGEPTAGSNSDDCVLRGAAGDRKEPSSALPAVGTPRAVILRVRDTGQGMSDCVKAHAFEPYFTTKPPNIGTGLGLATVADLVYKLAGQIVVDSQPGQGSTFTLSFPAVEPHAAPVTPHPGGPTVLLVEDDLGVRDLLSRILNSNGFNVLVATSGVEALVVADQAAGPIHLLVTDVVMPRLSGRQLAEHLLAQRPGLRVLFLSGYTASVLDCPAGTGNHSAFLQKPFVPHELLAKVKEVLK
jgi:CheY-like chemotaxis protein